MLTKLAVRSALRLKSCKVKPILNTTVRRHGHAEGSGIYRMMAPDMYYGPQIRLLKSCQVSLFAWISYNLWYDPEMVFGHAQFDLPDPSLWTDEQLGIPPDDYDEVV